MLSREQRWGLTLHSTRSPPLCWVLPEPINSRFGCWQPLQYGLGSTWHSLRVMNSACAVTRGAAVGPHLPSS